jgi:predicted nucleic acid-binding protein
VRTLLDNDLFFSALVRGHIHHSVSRRWLDRMKPSGWGIASETYLAAVRLLMNPKVMGSAVLPAVTAVKVVEVELSGPFPGRVVLAPSRPSRTLIASTVGHREVMDAWLVQIARETGHKLATHDKGMLARWPDDTRGICSD